MVFAVLKYRQLILFWFVLFKARVILLSQYSSVHFSRSQIGWLYPVEMGGELHKYCK